MKNYYYQANCGLNKRTLRHEQEGSAARSRAREGPGSAGDDIHARFFIINT
jgi:hypothetical protein